MKRAIINARMYDVQTGKVQENTTILWEDGVIKKVEQQLDFPSNVEIIDGKGRNVTPGLINGFTHLGLTENGVGWEGNDSHEASGVNQSSLMAIDGIYPFDKGFEEARSSGITTAHVSPGPQNIISGITAIIKTHGNAVNDMAIQEQHGLAVSLGEEPKQAYEDKASEPKTRMGIASLIREQLRRVMYNSEPDADANKIFKKVLNKEIPMYIQAHRSDDIVTAVRLKKEFNINIVLVHGTESYLVVDQLSKADIPVLAGPFFTLKMTYEKRNVHPLTTTKLKEAGLLFALATPTVRNMILEGSLAVREGLSEMDALYSLTLGGAKILGISDDLGSIEPGKEADLVIWNGEPLEIMSNIEETIIGGKTVYKKGVASL